MKPQVLMTSKLFGEEERALARIRVGLTSPLLQAVLPAALAASPLSAKVKRAIVYYRFLATRTH